VSFFAAVGSVANAAPTVAIAIAAAVTIVIAIVSMTMARWEKARYETARWEKASRETAVTGDSKHHPRRSLGNRVIGNIPSFGRTTSIS
jgi:hypothetical protein